MTENPNGEKVQIRRALRLKDVREMEEEESSIEESEGETGCIFSTRIWITIKNNNSYHKRSAQSMLRHKIDEEPLEPQSKLSYEEALDTLLNGKCCFGVYDKGIK